MTSCHVRVAVGLVAPLLRIGARGGVKNVDRMPTWCFTALGARSMRMRVARSTANVGLCSMYICWCMCVSMLICTFVYGVAIPAPQRILLTMGDLSVFKIIYHHEPPSQHKVHGEGISKPWTAPYVRNKLETAIYVIHIVNCLNRYICT